MSIFKLFKSEPAAPTDGLTQTQREAIVDLLHYCIYADGHVAYAEGKMIEGAVEALDWGPAASFESYEAGSVSRARHAREDTEYRTEFLASALGRLDTDKAKRRAEELCGELISSDGSRTPAEQEVLSSIRRLFA